MDNATLTDDKAESWTTIMTSCITHMTTNHGRSINQTMSLYKQVQEQIMPQIAAANKGCPLQAFILLDALMVSITSAIQCMSLDSDENLGMALVTFDAMMSKHRQALIDSWDEAEQQFENNALIAEPKGNA